MRRCNFFKFVKNLFKLEQILWQNRLFRAQSQKREKEKNG